jgi:hypothetical protein
MDTKRTEIFEAVNREASYQDIKWGADKQQSLPGYLLIMKRELDEAIDGWMKNSDGRHSCLSEVLQVVTVGVRCLEYYGTQGCSRSTPDVTEAEMLEERRQASERRFGAR